MKIGKISAVCLHYYLTYFSIFFFSYFSYLLRNAVLAITAFCSSSRPCELRDVRVGAFRVDEQGRGVWFNKHHGKRKGGNLTAVCLPYGFLQCSQLWPNWLYFSKKLAEFFSRELGILVIIAFYIL